jgi:TPR repeat protein
MEREFLRPISATLTFVVSILATPVSAQTAQPVAQADSFDWQSPELIRAECEKGDAKSCLKISEYYKQGRGVPRSPMLGKRYADMACSLGLGEVCDELARHLQYPKPEAALPYFRKSCDFGYYYSCNALSYMLRTGQGTIADPVEADKVLDGALAKVMPECESGNGVFCNYAALLVDYKVLGDSNNTQVNQLYAKAIKYLSEDCNGTLTKNCDVLAGLYRSGSGVPKDLNSYARYSSRSCFAGMIAACEEMRITLLRLLETRSLTLNRDVS